MLAKQTLRVDFIVFVDHKITSRKVEGLHVLNGTDTLDTWSVYNFSWNIFLAFFSSLFEQFFSLLFSDLSYHSLGLVSNISLKFAISFHFLQYFMKFNGWEMILTMLSNLLWAGSLMASCFSGFMVKVLKCFHVMTVARERSRLVPLKAMPTGRPTPLANAAIEISPFYLLFHCGICSFFIWYLDITNSSG